MLVSFRFANHRSFRDEQQLNLAPVYGADGGDAIWRPVPVAGVFGANASGKSNVLRALAFARRMATASDRDVEPGGGLATQPFRLDSTSTEQPSRYVVDLLLDGVRHTYGFSLTREKVLEEWLYQYPLKRRRKIFERDGIDFTWGEESKKSPDLERIADITAPTALFLSTVARFRSVSTRHPDGTEALHDVYSWFYRSRILQRDSFSPFSLARGMAASVLPDGENGRGVIQNLMRVADVGIVEMILKEVGDPDEESLFSMSNADNIRLTPAQINSMRARKDSRHRLQFSHQGVDGTALFDLSEESTGTLQLLGMAIEVQRVLRSRAVLAVDEIDASLHPMLTAQLIKLFQDQETNPNGSQLIFTTHDSALLGNFDGNEVLHRDQIWFTEKDDGGVSSLYPLSEFRPRKDGENRQRRYLNGNYGGIPDLSADLFAQALARRESADGQGSRHPSLSGRRPRSGDGPQAHGRYTRSAP